jgi:Mg2+ and Co2+ transporter CorA
MNRSEAAFLAHLDAIENRFAVGLDRIERKLDEIKEDIAGIKIDLATHNHGDDS